MSYWTAIDAAEDQLKTARTVDEVFKILGAEPGFWGGDGDDMLGALYEAGWRSYRYEAPYYWVIASPVDGEYLSYTEGDVHRGDNPSCGR